MESKWRNWNHLAECADNGDREGAYEHHRTTACRNCIMSRSCSKCTLETPHTSDCAGGYWDYYRGWMVAAPGHRADLAAKCARIIAEVGEAQFED